MKKFLVIIVIIFSVFAVKNTLNVKSACFSRHDIGTDLSIEPEIDCVKLQIGQSCLEEIFLEIRNNCDKNIAYVDGTIIQNFPDYYQAHVDSGVKKEDLPTGGDLHHDYDIPQEYVSWEREFYFVDDPDTIYTIKAENYKINDNEEETSHVKDNYWLISIVVLLGLIIAYIVVKNKNNKQKDNIDNG